jgi:hypothetical protein
MNSITRIVLVLMALLTTSLAYAEQSLCLIKKSVAYSVEPLEDKPLPIATKQLASGTRYLVVRKASNWYLLQVESMQLWVARTNTGDDKFCATKAKKPVSTAKALNTNTALPKKKSTSSCPCGSGQVCIGPRGGRYCISPNGAKRYGV